MSQSVAPLRGVLPIGIPLKALQIVILREYRAEEYVVVAREHSEALRLSGLYRATVTSGCEPGRSAFPFRDRFPL